MHAVLPTDRAIMDVVAILMEYKSDAQAGRSGPGDVLRLAHALRHPSLADKQVKVISTLEAKDVGGLITTEQLIPVRATERYTAG